MKRLADLIKKHYHTNCYKGAHFRMGKQVLASLHALQIYNPVYNPIELLFSIPIILDETMDDYAWKLIDTLTGDLLESGYN